MKKSAPTKAFSLYEYFLFLSACRVNDLSKREFEQHVKEHTENSDKYIIIDK